MKAEISTPYKAHLAGSYTVLDGGAALCLALKPKMRVVLVDQNHPEFDIDKVGLGGSKFVGDLIDFIGKQLRFDREIMISDIDDPFGGKGLGSSAALAVSLTVGIAALAKSGKDRTELFRVARDAHRHAQGNGSGSDVAACIFGGLVAITGAGGAATPTVKKLLPPPGLEFIFFDGGGEKKTAASIKSYHSWAPGERSPAVVEMDRVVVPLVEAIGGRDVDKTMAMITELGRAQVAFESKFNLGLFGSWLIKAQKLIEELDLAGVSAIPLGSGGDECFAVVFNGRLFERKSLEQEFTGRKFLKLDVTTSSEGSAAELVDEG